MWNVYRVELLNKKRKRKNTEETNFKHEKKTPAKGSSMTDNETLKNKILLEENTEDEDKVGNAKRPSN